MNTISNPFVEYSGVLSGKLTLTLAVLFSALCMGGLIGLQLDHFLEIKCAVRGTCYGDDSFAYNASLIHPLVIKLFLSSIALMGVSLLLKSGLLFDSLKTAGVMSEADVVHVKKMASALLNLGGIFLLLSIPLIVMSWGA